MVNLGEFGLPKFFIINKRLLKQKYKIVFLDNRTSPIWLDSACSIRPAFCIVSLIFWFLNETNFCSFDTFIQVWFVYSKTLKVSNVIHRPIKPVFTVIVWHKVFIANFEDIPISEKLKKYVQSNSIISLLPVPKDNTIISRFW